MMLRFGNQKHIKLALIIFALTSFCLFFLGTAYYVYDYKQSIEFKKYHRYYQLLLANNVPRPSHGRQNIFQHDTASSRTDLVNMFPQHQPNDTTLVSFNIRFNAPWIARVAGEKAWHVRKYGVLDVLLRLPPDAIVGIQEAKMDPLTSITFPNTHFSYFGVGRDDGVAAGEFAPILFNQRFWRLVEADYKWLSHTPEIPSKFPGTGHKRIATMCKLENIHLGKQVIVLNTHLDHQVASARKFSVTMLHEWMSQLLNQTQPTSTGEKPDLVPVFLMGDFNLISEDIAYKKLTSSEDITDLNVNKITDPTYVGFNSKSRKSVIDFVFALNFNKSKWRDYTVLDNVFHRMTISDHRPIAVSFEL